MNINSESFIKVSQIIERDSKDTTYKFALIRSTIDIIKQYDHHSITVGERIHFPTGLLVEKWLLYYYPLISSSTFFPQKNGEPKQITSGKNISFRSDFNSLINSYSPYGNFEHFYNEYKRNNLPSYVQKMLHSLVLNLYKTITSMPMKYIGKTFSADEYSIYKIEKRKTLVGNNINTIELINSFGTFSIPSDYYLVLKYLGGFIGGENAILNYWADFIVKANRTIPIEKEIVIKQLMITPESFRDVSSVKNYYSQQSNLFCVWSGNRISNNLNVDHILPFAHYLNSDIWNLLPTTNTTNSKKSDKVPTPELITKQSDLIISYWLKLQQHYKEAFNQEIKVSLSNNFNMDDNYTWTTSAIDSLINKAQFLIDVKGLEPWKF